MHNGTNAHHDAEDMAYLAWYQRLHTDNGEPFDPTLLVALAQEQWSDMPQLALAFARCTAQWPERGGDLYTHFIAPKHMRARWKFHASRFLQHPTWGTLVVDVIHDSEVPGGLAIGGMEYLDRVMRHQDQVHDPTPYWPLGYDPEPLAPAHLPTLQVVHRGDGAPARARQAELHSVRRTGGA